MQDNSKGDIPSKKVCQAGHNSKGDIPQPRSISSCRGVSSPGAIQKGTHLGHEAILPVEMCPLSYYTDVSLSFSITSCAPPSMMLVEETKVILDLL